MFHVWDRGSTLDYWEKVCSWRRWLVAGLPVFATWGAAWGWIVVI